MNLKILTETRSLGKGPEEASRHSTEAREWGWSAESQAPVPWEEQGAWAWGQQPARGNHVAFPRSDQGQSWRRLGKGVKIHEPRGTYTPVQSHISTQSHMHTFSVSPHTHRHQVHPRLPLLTHSHSHTHPHTLTSSHTHPFSSHTHIHTHTLAPAHTHTDALLYPPPQHLITMIFPYNTAHFF